MCWSMQQKLFFDYFQDIFGDINHNITRPKKRLSFAPVNFAVNCERK